MATNGSSVQSAPALGGKVFHPYGDFLLHDVGTGDGIAVAMFEHYGRNMYRIAWKDFAPDTILAARNKVRTAPLWGVRLRPRLMHDGASVTFRDAILRHRNEADEVTRRLNPPVRRRDVRPSDECLWRDCPMATTDPGHRRAAHGSWVPGDRRRSS